MKREELEQLGLSKEAIDKIMSINGKDIENAKSGSSSDVNNFKLEIDGLKKQLSERNLQLEELKKSSVDNKTLTEQIEQLQKANEESANSYKNEINNLKISYEVEKALSGAKAKNLTATKALLDMSNVKFDKEGNLTGLKEQIDNLVSNDETKFLFNTDNANIFTPRGFVPGKADDSIRLNADVDTSSMSYAQLCSYYENNPNAD